jgi:hypothetical protein
MTTAIEATKNARQFERETCSRCGGSGEYSYCQMYGRKCFKCLGKKAILTKRGAAANDYCRLLRSRRAADLKAGDVIRDPYHGDCVVLEIIEVAQGGTSSVGGVMTPYRLVGLDIVTSRITFGCVPHDKLHCLKVDAAEAARTLAEALDYQDTLTKAGTPRRRTEGSK